LVLIILQFASKPDRAFITSLAFLFLIFPLRPGEKELYLSWSFLTVYHDSHRAVSTGLFQNSYAVERTNYSSSFFDRLEESIAQVNRSKKLSGPEIHTAFSARIAYISI